MKGPVDLLKNEGRWRTKMGAFFPGKRIIFRGCNYTYMELPGASLAKRKANCLKEFGGYAPATPILAYGITESAHWQVQRVAQAISVSALQLPFRKRAFMVGVLILGLSIFFCALVSKLTTAKFYMTLSKQN